MKKHFSIHVSGHVQDVWFRDSAKEVADDLGLCGHVKNESDGGVHIEVEGEETNLQKFIAWCHKGPRLARVENVTVTEGALSDDIHFKVIQ